MKRNFDAAFFDFDGTIADTGEGIFNSAQYALTSLGYPPATEAQLIAFIGPPIFDSFKDITHCDDEASEELSKAYRKRYSEEGILQFRIYDGMLELFKELKENGTKIAVVSSKPEHFVIRILNHMGIYGDMDYISCPKDDAHPENKTRLIERACLNLGTDKSKTVMIGDRRFDMKGAANAGVRSIGALHGYGTAEELLSSGAEFLAKDVPEMRKILLSL